MRKARPLGIASLEDKIVQQAVVTILNAIYEVDFKGFSYGFRPGRSPHQALDALDVGICRKRVSWILDGTSRGRSNGKYSDPRRRNGFYLASQPRAIRDASAVTVTPQRTDTSNVKSPIQLTSSTGTFSHFVPLTATRLARADLMLTNIPKLGTSVSMVKATKPAKQLTTARPVESLIHVIRGQKVMLDADLAALYQVEPSCTDPGGKTQCYVISRGFHVPAISRGGRRDEVTICDLIEKRH